MFRLIGVSGLSRASVHLGDILTGQTPVDSGSAAWPGWQLGVNALLAVAMAWVFLAYAYGTVIGGALFYSLSLLVCAAAWLLGGIVLAVAASWTSPQRIRWYVGAQTTVMALAVGHGIVVALSAERVAVILFLPTVVACACGVVVLRRFHRMAADARPSTPDAHRAFNRRWATGGAWFAGVAALLSAHPIGTMAFTTSDFPGFPTSADAVLLSPWLFGIFAVLAAGVGAATIGCVVAGCTIRLQTWALGTLTTTVFVNAVVHTGVTWRLASYGWSSSYEHPLGLPNSTWAPSASAAYEQLMPFLLLIGLTAGTIALLHVRRIPR